MRRLTIVEGDARASLASETPQGFDVLVVDAFSGDAIPLHLLTTQAVALYRRHLAPAASLPFIFRISMSIWSHRSRCLRRKPG